MAKTRYQVRDENFGLALYEADSPREALLLFLADRTKGALRPLVHVEDDSASITVDGRTFRTVRVP